MIFPIYKQAAYSTSINSHCKVRSILAGNNRKVRIPSVSYTHLDVYKRQGYRVIQLIRFVVVGNQIHNLKVRSLFVPCRRRQALEFDGKSHCLTVEMCIRDRQYGDLHQNRALTEHSGCQRLFLHADTLIFEHPIHSIEIEIKANLDEQWMKVMELFNWSI